MDRFAAAIAAAAEQSPMSNGEVTTVSGRLLLADGDGLCYYCAGNDDTAPGQARLNLIDKLRSAARASGAEFIKVVTTARGSHKGFRYAVARVKPYQGARTDSRRPRNWEFLRELLESGDIAPGIEVEFTAVAEADDLFSRYALHHPDCVIYTQDKDMRMVPGWHLDWLTHLMFRLPADSWSVTHNEKLWGRAWFWSQMLHGDGVDNIPGLPFYRDGSVAKSGANKGQVKDIKVGEKCTLVVDDLPKCSSDMGALLLCQTAYRSCYGDRWLVEMLEQGILLWMRNDETSSALNVVARGNPLHSLTTHEFYPAARAEIMGRIAEAMVYAETEDDRGDEDARVIVDAAIAAVRDMQAPVLDTAGCAGSRPLDGGRASEPAPGVQCTFREGREQLQAVRGEQPVSVSQWGSRLLAKA